MGSIVVQREGDGLESKKCKVERSRDSKHQKPGPDQKNGTKWTGKPQIGRSNYRLVWRKKGDDRAGGEMVYGWGGPTEKEKAMASHRLKKWKVIGPNCDVGEEGRFREATLVRGWGGRRKTGRARVRSLEKGNNWSSTAVGPQGKGEGLRRASFCHVSAKEKEKTPPTSRPPDFIPRKRSKHDQTQVKGNELPEEGKTSSSPQAPPRKGNEPCTTKRPQPSGQAFG